MMSVLRRIVRGALFRVQHLVPFLYHVRYRLGVRNTKHDISYCVFAESYVGDQYGIREFVSKLATQDRLVLFDLGRNHGFVLLFLADFISRNCPHIKRIDYVGVDPSPLKFAYPQHTGIDIHYRLMDRAIVYDDTATIKLKYGEDNFGNFNIAGSNYEAKSRKNQRQKEFIEIEVDTIGAQEIVDMISACPPEIPMIVKIDFKNQTERFFETVIDTIGGRAGPLLVSCERDGSAARDVAPYRHPGYDTLVFRNGR